MARPPVPAASPLPSPVLPASLSPATGRRGRGGPGRAGPGLRLGAGPGSRRARPRPTQQPLARELRPRIGLVIDRSNSIAGAGPKPGAGAGCRPAFVERLAGTGASVAVWSFGTLASGYSGPTRSPSPPPARSSARRTTRASASRARRRRRGAGVLRDRVHSLRHPSSTPTGRRTGKRGSAAPRPASRGPSPPMATAPPTPTCWCFTDGRATLHNAELADPATGHGLRGRRGHDAAIRAIDAVKDAGARRGGGRRGRPQRRQHRTGHRRPGHQRGG